MASAFDRQALLNIFTTEASDGLLKLANALDPRDGSTPTEEALREYFIIAHGLIGASSLYGFPGCASLAKILARMLEQANPVSPTEWSSTVTFLRDMVRTLRAQIDNINRKSKEDPTIFEVLKARYPRLLKEFEPPSPAAEPAFEEAPLPDDYFRPDLGAEILEYFIPEAQEYLETISSCLLRMERDPTNKDTIHQLFRAVHTLKGSAYTVGFQAIGDLTHHMEDIMSDIREGKMQPVAELTDLFFHAVDEIRLLLGRDPARLSQIRWQFVPLTQRLRQVATGQTEKTPVAAEPEERPQPVGAKETVQSTVRVSRDRLERLLNLVSDVANGRSQLEERLTVLEQLARQVHTHKNRLLETVRTFEEKHGEFSALEFDKSNDFHVLARCISEVSADVSEAMAQFSSAIREAREDMVLFQQMTTDLRDEIARTRMVPIGSLFTRFQKAVREMARMVGKDVDVVFTGAATEIDAGVVQRLVDPLIHMMRNAVAHGFEPPAVRKAAGKPEKGTVSLHAFTRNNTTVIEIEDDGAGLNVAKIKAKAIARGLVHPERAAAMPPAELIKLIYLPGFSTADEVDYQAGRGVGMDVVKRTITDLDGRIDIETEPGVGTKFIVSLPRTVDPEGQVVLAKDVPSQVQREGEKEEPGILLVDDSLSVRRYVGRMLEAAGYKVHTAADGEEGLRKAAASSYQVIIADLEMPKMNGYELIQALRNRPETKSTPIIVMTTRADGTHRQLAQSLGVFSYLIKPVEEQALIKEINQFVSAPTAAKPR